MLLKILLRNLSFKKESVEDYQGVLVPLAQSHDDLPMIPANPGTQDQIFHSSIVTPVTESNLDAEKADAPKLSSHTSKEKTPLTIDSLRDEIMAQVKLGEYSSSFDIKSIIINKAIQDMGMGRYNWSLFILCGFGWFADNLWLQQVALTLPSLSAEFDISENRVRYTTCYFFVGLCLGATFWGVGSDIMGRRVAFNMTLFIAGVFGLAVGGAQSWTSTCGIYLGLGFGVGGNLPVDGALFLEFLPNASGHLLTLMSIWWPIGQLVASFGGWGFMGSSYSVDNGWRFSCFTMGTITFVMFLARFLLFHLFESPKFLLSRGRQAEAVAVVHGIAYRNSTTTWLTEDILNKIGGQNDDDQKQTLSVREIIKRKASSFSTKRIGPLFATSKIGLNTTMLWYCWLAIGMGYPLFNGFLPQYLSNGQTSSGKQVSNFITYRNFTITSAMGIPGSILAYYTVDLPYIGRKGTMAVSTMMSGILLLFFTTSRAASYQLGFSAVQGFFQNIMYAVLYSYTPEVFPTPSRGTGTGISSLLNRIGGLCAPIIAANVPSKHPNAPILASGSLMLSAFLAMLFLSIETRGRQML